jgi:hypothetical protein
MENVMQLKFASRSALAATLIVAASPAFALMSPYYETATILERILSDGGVADALKQQSVVSVTLTSENVWELKSQECTVSVTVEFVKAAADNPAMGGGPNFDIKVGTGSCQ